jgi:hypothetical protein
MKKSLKKQAVFPVLMLLVVTALALIGSSFAWFSMSNTARVEKIEGKIEDSSVGLMISQDAANFTASITMGTSAATYIVPTRFHQVSTINAKTFYEATITKKNADGSAALIYTTLDKSVSFTSGVGKGAVDRKAETPAYTVAPGVASDASYMVFDLFFSVENDSDLYLNYGTNFTLGTGNKAMRVAFIDKGYVATGGTAAQAIALDLDGTALIWDPADEASYYGIKGASSSSTVFKPYASAADGVTDVSADSSTYAESVTTKISSQLFPSSEGNKLTDDTTAETLATFTSIAELEAGVNKIRVVVWLEGNDPDCVSKISGQDIDFTLVFYARKATPVTP